MSTIKFHYAQIDLKTDIPFFEFNEDDKSFNDFLLFLESNYFPAFGDSKNVVYLFSYVGEIFISDDIDNVFHFMESSYYGISSDSDDYWNMYLQEYPSYEEAYKVALDMKETNRLCYSESTLESPYWEK